MRDLQNQIETRRKQKPAASDGDTGLLSIGTDWFRRAVVSSRQEGGRHFHETVCLVATEFAKGGAIDRRELFAQDRVRKGIAGCLAALDAAGVAVDRHATDGGGVGSHAGKRSRVRRSTRAQRECRLLNSLAGIALGIHDFAPNRRSLREIGVIQWDRELDEMFSLPRGTRLATAQNAYRLYADQVKLAFRKGLAGEKTLPADVDGACSAIFSVQ